MLLINRHIEHQYTISVGKLIFLIGCLCCLLQYNPAQAWSPVQVAKEHFAIYYKPGKSDIDSSYLYNRQQLERIKFYLQNSPRIEKIVIYSYTSPEGGYQLNERLSKERGASAKALLLSLSPDSSKVNSSKITVSSEVENWQDMEIPCT